ncbi:unnamed protein product [Prorocentrum cordatum]|uniref:Uncharacterized protein n=1 Tax=Prorocentrum cordatum TaxID=2364126 RepID=A0ABN9PYY6_9DINO|nr:unnamed protein product [Polarella glacialis]
MLGGARSWSEGGKACILALLSKQGANWPHGCAGAASPELLRCTAQEARWLPAEPCHGLPSRYGYYNQFLAGRGHGREGRGGSEDKEEEREKAEQATERREEQREDARSEDCWERGGGDIKGEQTPHEYKLLGTGADLN